MTQYLATCETCGGKVSHLEETASVPKCDACKGKSPSSDAKKPAKETK